MIKNELRKVFKEKRMQLSQSEKAKLDDLLLIQFQQVGLPFIQRLFCYWPIDKFNEPNTHLFCDYIEFRNPELIIAYPRIEPATGKMEAIIAGDETIFSRKSFNVFEPEGNDIMTAEEVDLAIVPLLCFDKKGFRVGYGKGYYDRYLKNCRKDCLKIGFSYFEPVDQITDKHEFDVPLDLCVTPHATYVF